MDKTTKAELVAKYGATKTDTGSPAVQIALLTSRIVEITEHMRTHAKDFSTRHGLNAMVNKRKKLLKYLSRENYEKYVEISNALGLRGQK